MSAAPERTGPSAGRKPRVLLVDDNAPGRRALAKVLEASQYDVTSVADGTAALAALAQSPPPEFVLTDLMLPDIDGREIARAARALEPLPFIALITGWSLENDQEDPKHWGVDHVFLKPLRVGDMLAKLAEVTARSCKPG